MDKEKLLKALENELYGYRIIPGFSSVRIEKTIYKARLIEIEENCMPPLNDSLRRYMFTAELSWEEVQGMYEHKILKGLRFEYERMIEGYMEGD